MSSSTIPEAGSETPGYWGRLAWLSIPLLAAAILALWVANLQVVWNNPSLQNACFYGPPVLAVLLIVIPTARHFLKDGQPIVLMLGCAVLIAQIGWVVSSLVFASDPDKFFASYNFPILLSALCHFVSVAFISRYQVPHGRRGWMLVASLGGVLALMGMVNGLISADLMPVFFIPGRGGTPMRSLTLGAAVVLYGATTALLWEANRRVRSNFLHWYSMGLALLAIGLMGATLIVLRNSPLHWATRTTQVVGTVYMCIAGLASVQARTVTLFPIEAVVESRRIFESFRGHAAPGWVLRYLLSVMAPMAATWVHLALTQRFGPGLPTYVLFYPVVMTLAMLGGLGPGLLATGVSGLLVVNYILPPVVQPAIASPMDRLGLVIFMGMGMALSLGAEFLRRYQTQAADYQHQKSLADAAAELHEAQRLTHIGSWQWAAGSDVTTASNELYQMYGIDPTTEAFPSFQAQRGRCYPPEDWERFNAAVQRTLQTGIGYELDVNVIQGNTLVWVTTRGEAVRDAKGRITGLRGTVQDITERKQAEERLQKLSRQLSYHVDHSPLAVIEWGQDMRLTRWSGEAERMFGWTAEEVLGKRMEDFRWIYQEDEAQVEEVSQGLQTGAHPRKFSTNRNYRKDGSIIHCEWYNSSMNDESGTFQSILSLVLDVTERKRLEERLIEARSEAEQRARDAEEGKRTLDALLNYIPEGITIVSAPDVTAVHTSRYGDQLLAEGWDSTSGMSMEDWLAHVDPYLADGVTPARPEDLPLWKAVKRGETVEGQEMVLRKPDGSLIRVLCNAGPIRNDHILGGVVAWRDITARKAMEEALRQSIDQLQKMEAVMKAEAIRKDEFIALLGHELRNPLVPIGNAVYLMRMAGQDPAIMDSACTIAERQLAHITRLVDDLLDVSRIARGKIQLKTEVMDLFQVMGGVVQDYQPVFAENNLTLVAGIPSGSARIHADKVRIVQAVSNLLHNASKFTEPGGQVSLTTGVLESEWAEVTVKNSGAGIPPDMLSTIFEPFMQRRETIGRAKGGLGLGLGLAKGLVELHGGSLSARSEGPGMGAEFTIRLPLAKVDGHPEAHGPSAGTPESATSRRILIVEDVADAATTLKLLLELWGHTVQVAHDGRTGLEKADRFSPEIILCDIGLPGELDGYAVARAIRKRPAMERVHLIAMTGFGADGAKEEARQAGFDAHMTKPVEPEALEKTIAGLPSARVC